MEKLHLLPEPFEYLLQVSTLLNRTTQNSSEGKPKNHDRVVEDLKRSFLNLGNAVRDLVAFLADLENKKEESGGVGALYVKDLEVQWISIAKTHFSWSEETSKATVQIFQVLYNRRFGEAHELSNKVQLYVSFPRGGIINNSTKNDAWPGTSSSILEPTALEETKIKEQKYNSSDRLDLNTGVSETQGLDSSYYRTLSLQSECSAREIAMKSFAFEGTYRLEFFKSNLDWILWILCGAPLKSNLDQNVAEPRLDDFQLDKCQIGSLFFLIGMDKPDSTFKELTDSIDGSIWKDDSVICKDALADFLASAVEKNSESHANLVTYDRDEMITESGDCPETSIVSPLLIKSLIRGTIVKSSDLHAFTNTNENLKTQFTPAKRHISNENGEIAKVIIANCKQCTIYLLNTCGYVRIVGCQDCTIVLGPVSGIVSLDYSDRVRVIAPAKCFLVSNTVDSELCVCLKLRPILTGDCRRIRIGPYNTFYPRLLSHLRESSLNTFTREESTLWRMPLVLDSVDICKVDFKADHSCEGKPEISSAFDHNVDYKCYSLCEADDFEIFIIPLRDHDLPDEEICSSIPFPIESEYVDMLRQKKKQAKLLLQAINKVGSRKAEGSEITSDGTEPLLLSTVQSAFRDWLVSTGKVRHIIDLVKLKPMLE